MVSDTKNISVCLIGDPSSEKFNSMEIYETELSGSLAGITGIKTLRHHWPKISGSAKNRYLSVLQGYWDRHWRYPTLLKPPSADLYHILDHSYAHLLSRLPPERTVITCHDIIPLMVEGYEESLGGKLSLVSFRHSVSYLVKVRHIIADSGATKKALINILGLADKKITVVPLGVDKSFCPGKTPPKPSKPSRVKYILQVGATAEPYKNTMNILRSFSLLLKNKGGHIKLLKVGKPYNREQQDYIEHEGLSPHIQYLGFVEREALPVVFRQASVLLMPSLYEGFGMPLLEAMACGVPVVTSCRGSIPEVAGDAVCYANPDDPRDIAAVVDRVLFDERLQSDLSARGVKRATGYTWQATAQLTVKVYRELGVRDNGQ